MSLGNIDLRGVAYGAILQSATKGRPGCSSFEDFLSLQLLSPTFLQNSEQLMVQSFGRRHVFLMRLCSENHVSCSGRSVFSEDAAIPCGS